MEIEEKYHEWFNQNPWDNLKTNSSYSVSAFIVNSSGKYPVFGILTEGDNGNKSVCYIKGPLKNVLIRIYEDKETLLTDGLIFITFKKSGHFVFGCKTIIPQTYYQRNIDL